MPGLYNVRIRNCRYAYVLYTCVVCDSLCTMQLNMIFCIEKMKSRFEESDYKLNKIDVS